MDEKSDLIFYEEVRDFTAAEERRLRDALQPPLFWGDGRVKLMIDVEPRPPPREVEYEIVDRKALPAPETP